MLNGTNGANETVSAFFYGTLMHPAVLRRVVGNDASHLRAAPAVLMSFTRHHVRSCDYPAIVPYNVGAVLLNRELNRDERCVRGVIISGLRPEDVACLDIFEGDEYNRITVEAHPIVPLAPISPTFTQTLLSASSELPAELPPTLKVETYVWIAGTSRLEPMIWEYDTFVKEKLWKWAGSGADGNEYYEEVDRRRDMNGVIIVPSGGEGTLKPDYTFGHNMLQYFMFDKGYINLNHGSYGSLPRSVFDKCVELSKRIEGRPDSFHRREYQSELLDVRVRLAKLLNCSVDECVITNNTTHGLHNIINNFDWKEDDILVSFSTTYGAVSKICQYTSDKLPNPQHISIPLTFPVSHKVIIEEFRQKLRDIPRRDGQTIVAIIDALASNPGVLLPWEEMTTICKEEGVYSLIDAAHAIGQIPLDLSRSNPDFFVSNCHKWLYAKRGSAVVYVAKRNQGMIRSSFPTSHAYVSLKSGKETDIAAQFEWTGTIDFVPFLSIKYALDFREAIGGEKHINDYCHALAINGGAKLAEILKTRVMETEGNELTVNMVNVQLPLDAPAGISSKELGRIFRLIIDRLLDEHNVFAAIYIHDNHWWTRCSAQIWNEEFDFTHLGRAFLKICEEVQLILKELPRSNTSALNEELVAMSLRGKEV
ncbi:aminotransferase [Rhizoctonia solani 123E]|uniref:Aminotransferase n=1 Tax=Rhizoctonia solani 123E TaxID=1423351 RepID=A0A074S2S5_9AGAM|nr:aminotransferase [Rhizoctonia solani 123E]